MRLNRTNKKITSLLFAVLMINSVFAVFMMPVVATEEKTSILILNRDPPVEEWNRTFGGAKTDLGYSVQQTTDGGFIITGWTTGAGGSDVWLIKTDSKGNEEWNRTFGGAGSDSGFSVQQTIDGGFIITGSTMSFGAWDIWLIKTDSKGKEEWNRTFGGAKGDWGISVQQTTDSGFIINGWTMDLGADDVSNIWLIKTDSQGNKEWSHNFGGAKIDLGTSVQQTADGGFIITGVTMSFGAGDGDLWLIKTDSRGNKEWNRTFGGAKMDRGSSVRQTKDGGFIITGDTNSFGAGGDDLWLIKTDSKGNKEWSHTFGDARTDWGISVQQIKNDGFIITGKTNSFGAGGDDIWLIKTDYEGNKQWSRTFGGAADDRGHSVQQTTDGGFIITGRTKSFGAGREDIWLIKIAPDESAPIAITISPPTTLNVNATQQFNATVLPAGANQSVLWSVTNITGIGTINATGFFRAISAGTVNVTARSVVDRNITRNATVTIRPIVVSAPNIISFTPSSPVNDTQGARRTFNITIDQIANVRWQINGTEVQTNESVTEASYTNTSAVVGIWNVSAIVTNPNGTVTQTWVWNVCIHFTLELNAGWNMVSIPIVPDNRTVQAIFGNIPTLKIRPVVTWMAPRFVEVDEIHPKTGYWVFSPRPMKINITGREIENETLSLNAGWNMVGTTGMQNFSISKIPNQVPIRPAVTWKAPSFVNTEVIESGSSAWVFVTRETIVRAG